MAGDPLSRQGVRSGSPGNPLPVFGTMATVGSPVGNRVLTQPSPKGHGPWHSPETQEVTGKRSGLGQRSAQVGRGRS